MFMHAKLLSCVQLWNFMDSSPLGSSVHGTEYRSGLSCPPPWNLFDPGIKPISPTVCCAVLNCWVMSESSQPMVEAPRCSSVHGDSPGKNTWVGCHALLQGIFPTQGLNLCLLRLLHWRQILYRWATRQALSFLRELQSDIIGQVFLTISYLS